MNKTASTVLAATLLFGGAATKASAQTTPPTPPAKTQFGTGELPEFLKTYDLNNDGKLSAEERQAYERALRDARPPFPGAVNPWDTDGDGKLSDAEKQAARDAMGVKITEQRTRRFNELDINADGFLTAAELAGIPQITADQIARMIAHLDKNADGQVSNAEFLAVMVPVEPPIPPCPLLQAPPQFPIPVSLRPVMRFFDTDRNGFVSALEFSAAIALVDTDGDGSVSFTEWKTYVLAQLPTMPLPTMPPAP